jgi:hypothetical protein
MHTGCRSRAHALGPTWHHFFAAVVHVGGCTGTDTDGGLGQVDGACAAVGVLCVCVCVFAQMHARVFKCMRVWVGR